MAWHNQYFATNLACDKQHCESNLMAELAVEAWQQRSAVCHRGALRDQDQSAHAEEIVPKGKADQEEEDTQRWF